MSTHFALQELRKDYTKNSLSEDDLHSQPHQQFSQWLGEAISAKEPMPEAITVATAGINARPDARVVLLKEFDAENFVFYTNTQSPLGQQLRENAQATLLSWWPLLERQVRIYGKVQKTSPQQDDTYFAMRPRGAQLSAWASRQSTVVKSREDLERQLQAHERQFAHGTVPRPLYWGGFSLAPEYYEFWQGRANRLHDRLCYIKSDIGAWRIERLSP